MSLTRPQGQAKAWVNFNGVGTVAIRGSYNVSSITDQGTGIYDINYDINMSNTNYSVSASSCGTVGDTNRQACIGLSGETPTLDHIRIRTTSSDTVVHQDVEYIYVQVFGDAS